MLIYNGLHYDALAIAGKPQGCLPCSVHHFYLY